MPHQDNVRRLRSSSKERIKRLKKILHSLATRIPIVAVKRVEEEFPSLFDSLTVKLESQHSVSEVRNARAKKMAASVTCKKCQRTYFSQPEFDIHKCRNYECKVCHRTFTYNSYLKRHLLLHSCTSPSACETCGKIYKCNKDLKLHIRMMHENRRRCDFCSKVFIKQSSLKSHRCSHYQLVRHEEETDEELKEESKDVIQSDHVPENNPGPEFYNKADSVLKEYLQYENETSVHEQGTENVQQGQEGSLSMSTDDEVNENDFSNRDIFENNAVTENNIIGEENVNNIPLDEKITMETETDERESGDISNQGAERVLESGVNALGIESEKNSEPVKKYGGVISGPVNFGEENSEPVTNEQSFEVKNSEGECSESCRQLLAGKQSYEQFVNSKESSDPIKMQGGSSQLINSMEQSSEKLESEIESSDPVRSEEENLEQFASEEGSC